MRVRKRVRRRVLVMGELVRSVDVNELDGILNLDSS